MKLKRLKINQPYRSLEKGFEINFKPNLDSEKLDPICLVGPNGSGKSNVLEALADIFYYLDIFISNYSSDEIYAIPIEDFDLEYYLPTSIPGVYNPKHNWEKDYCLVKIQKRAGFDPLINSFDEDKSVPILNKYLLPIKVWGYSSGENEILSLPFLRMDLNYFEQLEVSKSNDENNIIETNRLHYIDYDTCASIILSNFIMLSNEKDRNKLGIFLERFGIESLSSFKFTIRRNYWMKKNLELPNEIDRFISTLKKYLPDSCFHTTDNGEITFNIDLEDSSQIKSFQNIAIGASGLYQYFESLSLLNTHTIAKHRRNKIKNGDDPFYAYTNLYSSPNEKLPFNIEELMINMVGIDSPIPYKTISDGEHQALTIIGLFNMMDEDGVLCLLDEPETHLNPQWKYGFIDTLNSIQNNYKSQVIITTHDPIFISGLRKEDVILFKRNSETQEGQKRWSFADKDLKGMGVDSILTSDIFGFQTTLDNSTQKQLIERRILMVKQLKSEITKVESQRLKMLTELLSEIDYANPINDPLYADFISASEDLEFYSKKIISHEERSSRKERAIIALDKLRNYEKR